MNIDRKFVSWVFGIVATTVVTLVIAEDRWNQGEKIEGLKNTANSSAYLMYETVIEGVQIEKRRLMAKQKKTPQDHVDLQEALDRIDKIRKRQDQL